MTPGQRLLAAFTLLLALAWLPVLSVTVPPLLDYPNHLARMHILADDGRSAWLTQFYRVRWSPLPNLAMDLIVPPLARLLPLVVAGRVFLLLLLTAMAGGAAVLHRVLFGRWTAWPLGAFLLLYNRMLLWGFVNYLFGLALLPWALALWVALARRPWLRLGASLPVALALFFAHIEAFGLYGLAICGIELEPAFRQLRHREWRGLGAALGGTGAQFVLPAALFLMSWRRAAGSAGVGYGSFWRKADLPFSVMDNYGRPFDVACFALAAALLLALALRRRLTIAPAMRWPLMLILAAYLALPTMLYSGFGADRRVPIALFLLLVAASAPSWPSRRVAAAVGIAAALVFVLRMGVIERVWLRADAAYRRQIAALDLLPAGSRLAVANSPDAVRVSAQPELHLPVLAVARRDAFVPTLFVFAAQQPVAFAPPYDRLAAAVDGNRLWRAFVAGDPAAQGGARATLASFDAIAFVAGRPFTVLPSPCLAPLYRDATFQLWRIEHEGCGG